MSNTQYCITDGHKYINQSANGRWSCTTNINLADTWAKKETAVAILNHSLPLYMRKDLYVVSLECGSVKRQETLSRKEISECRKEVSSSKVESFDLSKYSFEEDEEVQNMIDGFESVRYILKTYGSNSYAKEIGDKVMRANLILEDVKHYHGRKALNSRDGFRLNRLEDAAVIERISVKNQAEIAKKLQKYYADMLPMIEDICSTIDELRAQKYTPRILGDLFASNNLDINVKDYIEGKAVYERKDN